MTQKQQDLIETYLAGLSAEERPTYQALIGQMVALGYAPKKERQALSFKHGLHNKQLAKLSCTKGENPAPVFALRFSACRGYSKRFDDIVRAAIQRFPARTAGCLSGECPYCQGEAETHVYLATFPGGEVKNHCGTYVMEIPGLSAADVAEVKALIAEEHAYLLKHEAGVA